MVVRYELQRAELREGRQGEWRVIAELVGSPYYDSTCEQGVDYVYRVVSHAGLDLDDAAVAEGLVDLDDDQRWLESAVIGPLRLLAPPE